LTGGKLKAGATAMDDVSVSNRGSRLTGNLFY